MSTHLQNTKTEDPTKQDKQQFIENHTCNYYSLTNKLFWTQKGTGNVDGKEQEVHHCKGQIEVSPGDGSNMLKQYQLVRLSFIIPTVYHNKIIINAYLYFQ